MCERLFPGFLAPTCHRQEYSLAAFRWFKWKLVTVMCNDDRNTRLRRCPEKDVLLIKKKKKKDLDPA